MNRACQICLAALIGGLLAARAVAENVRIEIRAIEGMRFDPPRKNIQPGQRLTILFQNADATDQPHNLVIIKPGKIKETLDAALALGGEGPAREFVPANGSVLVASKLLTAGQREELVFDVPAGPGIYPYVCTFPGHGFLMFGAFYAGVRMPAESKDPNIPQIAAVEKNLAPDPRPMVRRIFMPDCGPAAIAVALPGRQNFCWDAGACRLRYIWEGGFLDAEDYFKSKGQANARILGKRWWTAPAELPLRIGAAKPTHIKFNGYTLVNGIPTFEYTLDGTLIKERLSAAPTGGVRREFEVVKSDQSVEFLAGPAEGVQITPEAGALIGGRLKVAADGPIRFAVTMNPKKDPNSKTEP
ncbi:MAG: hypothetical protein ACR2OZ_08500 [Verrucomicrobiales bacterium]